MVYQEEGDYQDLSQKTIRTESSAATFGQFLDDAESVDRSEIQKVAKIEASKSGSTSNYKEIFKEIFMVLARANNNNFNCT